MLYGVIYILDSFLLIKIHPRVAFITKYLLNWAMTY